MDGNNRAAWCATARKAVVACKAGYLKSEHATHHDKARMTAKIRKALDLIGGVLEAKTDYRAEVLQAAAMSAIGEVTEEMTRLDRMMPIDPKFHR